MSTRIRRLDARDKACWRALFEGYIAFYGANVPDEVIELTWRRMTDGASDALVGIAAVDADDQPVGFAHVLFHWSTWSATSYCYLEDLFVRPDVRGQGCGRALIEATYAEADRRSCNRVYWVTETSNTDAQALYERMAKRAPFVQYRR